MEKHKSSKILSDFIIAGKRPRNQIATLSGLTNTYIQNLEKGKIANVPKKRLISLGIALNLNLFELEILLQAFDRAALMPDDIPTFIEVARVVNFSEAVLSVRDLSAYELVHLSLESTPGRQVIVNDRPTNSLMVEGHRTHINRHHSSRHSIYDELNETIGTTRRKNLLNLVDNYPVDHYICKSCLEDYLDKNQDHTERFFRYKHVLSLLDMVKTQKKFNLYITETCFELLFTMKFSDQNKINNKLSYSSRAPHNSNRRKRGRINGFITENPPLCKCFEEELQQISETTLFFSKEDQVKYLLGLLEPIATELGEKFTPEI